LLSGTHQRIGLAVLSCLEARSAVNVAVDDYLFGCIKPDFSLGAFYTPHLKHKSFDFVLRLIAELGDSAWPVEGKVRKALATRLGVVMHYLADFFCTVHNQRQDDSLPLHFAYEANLLLVSRGMPLENMAQEALAELKPGSLATVGDIASHLERLHRHYLATPMSPQTDLCFALAAGTAAAYYVFSADIRAAVRPAA
jgi:hypothetical protein